MEPQEGELRSERVAIFSCLLIHSPRCEMDSTDSRCCPMGRGRCVMRGSCLDGRVVEAH